MVSPGSRNSMADTGQWRSSKWDLQWLAFPWDQKSQSPLCTLKVLFLGVTEHSICLQKMIQIQNGVGNCRFNYVVWIRNLTFLSIRAGCLKLECNFQGPLLLPVFDLAITIKVRRCYGCFPFCFLNKFILHTNTSYFGVWKRQLRILLQDILISARTSLSVLCSEGFLSACQNWENKIPPAERRSWCFRWLLLFLFLFLFLLLFIVFLLILICQLVRVNCCLIDE